MTEPKPSPSTTRYRSHPVHTALQQWRERIVNECPNNIRELGSEARNAFVRFQFVLRSLESQLKKANPMLVSSSGLENIKSQLENSLNSWNHFRKNPQAHWQQLESQTDNLVNNFARLPIADGSATWTNTFDGLRSELEEVIQESIAEVNELTASANETDQKFQEARNQLSAFESEIAAQKTRLDEMLTQHTAAFNASEQDRAKRFTESQDEKKTHFDSLMAEFGTEEEELISSQKEIFSKTEEELNEKTTDLLTKIQEQLDKAVEIVGIIVKTTMSGNYQIIANREYRNAWTMRWIAIFSFAFMAGMIVWGVSALHVDPDRVDWRTVALRLSLGITFLIPGFYCAKESSRHWNGEKHNRILALELAALGPFLVTLDEAKQKAIIEKKADEYFGTKQYGDPDDELLALRDIHISGDKLLKVVERLAKVLRGSK